MDGPPTPPGAGVDGAHLAGADDEEALYVAGDKFLTMMTPPRSEKHHLNAPRRACATEIKLFTLMATTMAAVLSEGAWWVKNATCKKVIILLCESI